MEAYKGLSHVAGIVHPPHTHVKPIDLFGWIMRGVLPTAMGTMPHSVGGLIHASYTAGTAAQTMRLGWVVSTTLAVGK